MKPAPFRYVAARTVEQALQLKAEYGDEARFLAGGSVGTLADGLSMLGT